jgi:hypothetical protein
MANETASYCPLCSSRRPEIGCVCACGFDFDAGDVTDNHKVRDFVRHRNLKPLQRDDRISAVHRIQIQKHGEKGNHPGRAGAPGWSQRDTAELLNLSPATVLRSIRRSSAIELGANIHPDATRRAADMQLRERAGAEESVSFSSAFGSEENLQKYLESNWNQTELGRIWKLEKRGKYLTPVGEIDLLAKHKEQDRWLVIELKLDKDSDKVVGQTLRYMGWVTLNLAAQEETVEGLIICSFVDSLLLHALICASRIGIMRYKFDGESLQLISIAPRVEICRSDIRRLSDNDRRVVMKAFMETWAAKNGLDPKHLSAEDFTRMMKDIDNQHRM